MDLFLNTSFLLSRFFKKAQCELEKCQHLLEESEAAKERIAQDKKKMELELGEAKIELENVCAASREMEKRQREIDKQLAAERENVQKVSREQDAHVQKLRSSKATILSLKNELKQLNETIDEKERVRRVLQLDESLAEVKSLAQSRTRAEVAALEAKIRDLEEQNGVETRKRQEAMRQIRCNVRATQMLRQLDEKEGELRRERAKSTIQRREIDELTETNDTLTRENSRLRAERSRRAFGFDQLINFPNLAAGERLPLNGATHVVSHLMLVFYSGFGCIP
uniref:Myosin_tail_1 domain-containing protein n=1 Tax=Angiostrongylus cantonensis TaxID=6313 RepID=A0A0K0DRR3_ANGCA